MAKKIALGLITALSFILFFNTNSAIHISDETVFTSKIPQPFIVSNIINSNTRKEIKQNTFPFPFDISRHPFYEKEAKARLVQIANAFEKDIQYPANSKPIRNANELDKYTPNTSVASGMSTDTKDANSPRISIKSSKHQYFSNEPIQARASIESVSSLKNIQVDARLLVNGEAIEYVQAIRVTEAAGQYDIEFSRVARASTPSSKNVRIVAQFTIGQQQYEIGTPIRIESPIAIVDYVAPAFVNDASLHIPVFINTNSIGYHLISANLYNAKNNQALLHLSEQKNLKNPQDFIELKAHISALKVMGYEGPYHLKDISLTRMPSKPNYVTEYGESIKEPFSISAFPFSDYSNENYTDPDAQARLEFLTQLGEQD